MGAIETIHADRAHARMGASSAHRWSRCALSVRREELLPYSSSTYADEGTKAHEVADRCLTTGSPASSIEGIDDEMRDAVQQYLDYVNGLPGDLFVERRVDLSHIIPDGFGTCDAIVIHDGLLAVIDLKYGAGVKVYARENEQLMLYALGALAEFGGFTHTIDRVKLVIVQPRLDHIDEWELTADELIANGARLREAALRVDAPDAVATPGEKQCKFCKAKATCPERAQANLAAARVEFAPESLTPAEIAEILRKMPEIRAWLTAVEEKAFADAIAGACPPGWKLVEGRSNRVITDENVAAANLTAAGFSTYQIYKPRALRGITELEKLVGKRKFESLLDVCIAKPQGKPTLAPESDPRHEYSSAQADFA